jgi:anaerobic selenocysteine-containing dehydrogenase
MAHTILKNDLVDADFISKRTNTSLSALKSHLSAFPPSRAEEESGIKASDIENIAVEFATHKPSVAFVGGGVADHKNGVENVQSVLLLNWLVGHPISSRLAGSQNKKTLNGTRKLAESGTEINLYLSYLANPVFDEPNTPLIRQYFEDVTKVKFLAVLDTHMTETAMLADLVLPAATYLESWSLEHGPSFDQISVLSLRQPVVSLQSPAKILRSTDFDVGKIIDPSFRPRGEAKEVGNVCIEWARRIGGKVGRSFPVKNSLEFYSQEAEHLLDTAATGGIKTLKREGFWIGIEPTDIHIPSENKEKEGFSILPGYQAAESLKKKTEFTLTTYKPGFFVKGTMNSKWLREISHDNPLWINRKAAENLGIQNGDPLRISSESASLVVRALVTDRIHPESVALAEGFGHTATGRIAKAEKFKSSDRDTLLLWWKKEGKGINPNELIRGKADPLSGVFASKGTSVKIEKL